jgi:hypothetical protein
MTPASIAAPMPGTLPPTLGVGLPKAGNTMGERERLGLQEARVARDAWARVLGALERLQAAQHAETSVPPKVEGTEATQPSDAMVE